MKTTCFTILLAGAVMAGAGAEESKPRAAKLPGEPRELTQLRNAWLQEREQAADALDSAYLGSLETMRARLAKAGKNEEAAAVEKELGARLKETRNRLLTLPRTSEAAVLPGKEKPVQAMRAQLKLKLAGRVWRVDHEGEGLRWYYFAPNGSLARKSEVTNWVWTGLSGSWTADASGVIQLKSQGTPAQVCVDGEGRPKIVINHLGHLSERPLIETDLEYPGKGKE